MEKQNWEDRGKTDSADEDGRVECEFLRKRSSRSDSSALKFEEGFSKFAVTDPDAYPERKPILNVMVTEGGRGVK